MADQPSSTVGDRSELLPVCSDAGQNKDPVGVRLRDPCSRAQATGEASSPSNPEQWLGLHGDALFRYALLLVADEHHAEDLVQETLLAALQGRGRDSAAASERTWLIAIDG